jgi:Putative MetA-pathway of phenol degradation
MLTISPCRLMLLVLSLPAMALAQTSPCPTSLSTSGTPVTIARSGDLICLVPQVYGPAGLVGQNFDGPLVSTTGHSVHFQAAAVNNFGPVNSEIGVQLSQLPLASPASGFIFSFNPSLGVVARSAESFGPILTDRAETIGKKKLFVGVSYQFFNFDTADGVNLKKFGVVLTHEPEPAVCSEAPSTPGCPTAPTFTHDIVATQNSLDLKVHQLTIVATYGITNRLDVSVAVPLLEVRMAMYSDANIFNFEPPPVNHAFAVPATASIYETYLSPTNALFFNGNSARGIGDLVIRGKFLAWKGEHSAVAVGVDAHLPTGDANKFLGAGTWGVRPFLTYSYSGRVSPHASVGFQGNGDSVLAGDITTQPATKGHLPDLFTYSAGVDAGIARRLSVSFDFLGQSIRDAAKIASSTFTDLVGDTHNNITTTKATVNQASVAGGFKANLVGQLLFTANVLYQVNHAGLHSKPIPLVGLSYTF